ncbi:hypothetical protein FA95DRAFT_1601787 [Auriscalpium vulgare]|uniref:Uncharacterized protein n=1 Tax=Auriscalpium vulgare TaxID=40419 RepID=A0ACB8S894_9AGAM|nr:hypothetical protein FA95DRAFT_1601787 [Auriscalpium vulgare]
MHILAFPALLAVSYLSLRFALNVILSQKASTAGGDAAAGYIVHSSVTHARLRPADAKHAFTYPVLSLLLPLARLVHIHPPSAPLSLGWRGLLFSYGPAARARSLLSLRAEGYLYDDAGAEQSLPEKLARTLETYGYGVYFGTQPVHDGDGAVPADAWMLTMPAYAGYEGLNPLTVYFVYPRRDNEEEVALWLAVLEVHNTFGERHVYVLEVAGPGYHHPVSPSSSSSSSLNGGHTWTLPRAFHVSPFNDRLGTYTISVCAPSLTSPAKLAVKILLHEPPASPASAPALKLTATLTARALLPLTAPSIVSSIARYPFALLLTLPRILWEAGRLHYGRGLGVWRRPEPQPAGEEAAPGDVRGGGVAGQRPTLLERAAERVVRAYLTHRARETGVCVVLHQAIFEGAWTRFSSAPSADVPHSPETLDASRTLTITHLSPRFFVLLLLAPSAVEALTAGTRTLARQTGSDAKEFGVSDGHLFEEVFACSSSGDGGMWGRWAAWAVARRPGGAGQEGAVNEEGAGREGGGGRGRPLAQGMLQGAGVSGALLVAALVGLEWAEEAAWWVLRVRWET